MSWSTDRAIRDNRLLLVIIIGLVFIVAAGTFFYWSNRTSSMAVPKQTEQVQHPLIQPAFRNEPLSVTLYYPLAGMLVASPAPVKRQPDAQAQARDTLLALLQDQRAAQAAVLRDVKLRAFYLDSQGTAYIDLMTDQQQVKASAWDEQLAVYAMVNTLTQNFEEIKQVVFLMDGREAETLAGHIDLTRKYGARTDLIRP